jgi:hypothetical protein
MEKGNSQERRQRAALHHRRLRLAGGGQRLVLQHHAERVDLGIHALDALEHRPRQLDGRDLLGADHGGEPGGGCIAEVGGVHPASSFTEK